MEHPIMRFSGELPPGDERKRDLKQRLAASVRAVVENAVLVDAGSASEADLEGLISAVDDVANRMGAAASHRDHGGLQYDMKSWEGALFERSPISGRSNPIAAPLLIDGFDDDGVLHAHATYGYAYEGPPASLHGGVVAGAFDEMVGVGQTASGGAGFTAHLTVRMRKTTPLHQRIDYEAGVSEVDGRKVTVWSRSMAGGEVVGEAEALMIAPRGPLY
ncbi:MAG TPA: hypothetical protein VFB78_15540 [Acidimicrobiales bacterium]|nr:hypothetical protein [Acidimicrobiales bacterium]